MHSHEILPIGCKALEFFYVAMYTNCLSDFHKKLQVASTYDASVDYRIWSYFSQIMLIIYTQTNPKNYFRIQGTSKRASPSKSPFRKFGPKQYFLYKQAYLE